MKGTLLSFPGMLPQKPTANTGWQWNMKCIFIFSMVRKTAGPDNSALVSVRPENLDNLKRKLLIYCCNINGKLWSNTSNPKFPVLWFSKKVHDFHTLGQKSRTSVFTQHDIRFAQSANQTANEHISNVSSPQVTREDRTVTDFVRSGKPNNWMHGRLLNWILDRR